MSVRLEWTVAKHAGPSLHRRGDRLGDGQRVSEGDYALVIGSQVVQGSRAELVALCGGMLDLLDQRHVHELLVGLLDRLVDDEIEPPAGARAVVH